MMLRLRRNFCRRILLKILIACITVMAVFSIIVQWKISGYKITMKSMSPSDIVKYQRPKWRSRTSNERIQNDRMARKLKSTVYILDWTGFFGEPLASERNLSTCSYLNCKLTHDRSLIDKSVAVIFHARDMNWTDVPVVRRSWQYYVFFSMESPMSDNFTFSDDRRYFFNLTMTYRRDSDLWVPYGWFRKRERPLAERDLNLSQIVSGKSRMAAWFSSNCQTHSGREYYVKALKQAGIPIDIYGTCSTDSQYICTKQMQSKCNKMLKGQYKFYLAFENSLCTDYVTEKFYDRIRYYAVPIVLERRNYYNLDLVPSKSYIAIDQYKSIDDLSKHLLYLSKHDDEYAKYLHWHYNYEITNCPKDGCEVCRLCKLLVQLSRESAKPKIVDISKWWHDESGCQKPPQEIITKYASDPWWIDYFQMGLTALAIVLSFIGVILIAILLAFYCF